MGPTKDLIKLLNDRVEELTLTVIKTDGAKNATIAMFREQAADDALIMTALAKLLKSKEAIN